MRAVALGLAVLLACGTSVTGEDIIGRVALWPGAPKDGLKVCWLAITDVPLFPLFPLPFRSLVSFRRRHGQQDGSMRAR
jgi:hypothetical protein